MGDQSHWANYLCVLVSGLVENSVRLVYSEYALRCSNPQVASFVADRLKRPGNLKMEEILLIASRFDSKWRSWLEERTGGELKDAVDSIVDKRNSIAHGEAIGLSLGVVKRYYVATVSVVDLMHEQCGL